MPNVLRPRSRADFELVIVCVLQVEFDAVEGFIGNDWEEFESYGKASGDPNSYKTGSIGDHNVVIVYLPEAGTIGAAQATSWVKTSFRSIKLALLVGVCGGAPGNNELGPRIYLGDVVISTGVIQYDYGRQFPDQIKRKDTLESSLPRPVTEIRSFLKMLHSMKTRRALRNDALSFLYQELLTSDGFESFHYPGKEKDWLYNSDYRHKHQNPTLCRVCANCKTDTDPVCEAALNLACASLDCSASNATIRSVRDTGPQIHFGRVASGNLVLKSATHRDKLARDEKVIAFEMESAGVWEIFPCVIVKGVCDYADSHKSKVFQPFAAAAAAATMKAFLKRWRVTIEDASSSVPSSSVMRSHTNPEPESQSDFPESSIQRLSIDTAKETCKDIPPAAATRERQSFHAQEAALDAPPAGYTFVDSNPIFRRAVEKARRMHYSGLGLIGHNSPTTSGNVRSSRVSDKIFAYMEKHFYEEDDNSGVTFTSMTATLEHVLGTIAGPPCTAYEGGVFFVHLYFPEDYPFAPPRCKFLTKVYHPNIGLDGTIYIDFLLKRCWSPIWHPQMMMVAFGSLLGSPELDDSPMPEVSREYQYDRETFHRKARAWTEAYAKREIPPYEILRKCCEVGEST